MKHLLLLFAFLAASLGHARAQQALTPALYQAPITAFADSINRVFQAVDKSPGRIPSGILEEYGLQFIDHQPFTGTNGSTTDNQLDINRWRAIYGDLQGARINTASASMPTLAAVNLALDRYATDAYVELPILHFTYHSIRTDALSSGRLRSVSNRLYDVAGQNPYQLNTAFAIAASSAALPSASISFVLRPDLFWTNTGRTVASLQADLGTGSGFVAMSWNVPQPVSYASAGTKDVRVRVTYTDGSTFESHLRVIAPAPRPMARYAGDGANVTSFPLTADGTYTYNSRPASALISIEYGGRNKANPDPAVLDKPLIILKGFDISGILPMPTEFSRIDGRANYLSFVRQSLDAGGAILSDGADLDGYDIVYVDFDNGVDYIQSNALLVERVIRWVNENKTGNQPNVMLGMSMGGLIAQYALRDIETHPGDTYNPRNPAYPHQVRLLITHDSPQQGANVPVSVQLAVNHLAGTVIRNPLPFTDDIKLIDRLPVLGKARAALLSPAAQQLLRFQTTQFASGGFTNRGSAVVSPYSLYDTFQQEYQALLGPAHVPIGTPNQPCRVVASANGSECGRGQPFGPYAELAGISLNENFQNFALSDGAGFAATGGGLAGAGLALLFSGPVGIVGTGIVALVSLGLTGAYDLTAELHLHALPDQQQQQIYSVFAQVNKRTRLFGLFRVQFTLLDFQASSNTAQLPLDSGSGSIISLAMYGQQLGGANSSIPPGLIKQQQFCFVPTYSALNITPTSSAALRASYSPGTSVGSPFANFRTAGRENEQHIEYTALNSRWMLQELRRTPQVLSCAAFCAAAPTISGPNTICSTATTYSVAGLPPGTSVNWQLTTTSIVTQYAGNSPTFTTAFSGGTPSHGNLQATISSDCGQFTIRKAVDVGSSLKVAQYTVAGCGIGVVATLIGIDNVVWVVNGQEQTALSVMDGSREFFEYTNGKVTVALRGISPCTGASFTSNSVTKNRPTTGTQCLERHAPSTAPTATLYPNPARETVDVHVENASATDPVTVRLFDTHGQLRAEKTSNGTETVRLKTDQLPAGLYFVHILRGKQVVSHQQVQIEK